MLCYVSLLVKLFFAVSKCAIMSKGALLPSHIELAQLSFDLQLVISCFFLIIIILLVYIVYLDRHLWCETRDKGRSI